MRDIGEKIKTERELKGLTQKELGEALGLASNTICQYEKNSRHPSLECIVLLADFFNVTTDYLLGRED